MWKVLAPKLVWLRSCFTRRWFHHGARSLWLRESRSRRRASRL